MTANYSFTCEEARKLILLIIDDTVESPQSAVGIKMHIDQRVRTSLTLDSHLLKIPLKKGMATHSSILAWRIPWKSSLMGSKVHGAAKESDMTERLMYVHIY